MWIFNRIVTVFCLYLIASRLFARIVSYVFIYFAVMLRSYFPALFEQYHSMAFISNMTKIIKLGTSVLCCLVFSQWVYATDRARESAYATDIASAAPQFGQLLWLGETPERFLALYAETEQSSNRGVAILLHEMGGHPDKDPFIYLLRRELPKHNWATLALQMPVREQGATEGAYYALFPEANQRVLEAVRYLAMSGVEVMVLIGHQLGGLMAISVQANAPMDEIKAIVSIGLKVPETTNPDAQTLDLLKKLNVPLLDLYGAQDNADVVSTVRERRIAARDNPDYRQYKLDNLGTPYWGDQALVIKRIYSWLSRVISEQPKQTGVPMASPKNTEI